MVEAIMVEMKPKTQEKGNEMASARGPMSDTCLRKHSYDNNVLLFKKRC